MPVAAGSAGLTTRTRRVNPARTEAGVSAIEYALLAMLIALGMIVGARALGSTLEAVYGRIVDAVVAVLG